MSMNSVPRFTEDMNLGNVQISTANANLDGTGAIGVVHTAGLSGSIITNVIIQATVTTTAGMVRLFIDDGSNKRLYREIPVSATTPSSTVPAFRNELTLVTGVKPGLMLPAGHTLEASTEKGEAINIFAEGSDF